MSAVIDALLRRDTTPVAVELKVATGGQGRYYRRSLIQAVLYRHFIRNAPALDPWFTHAHLNRNATQAAIGIPTPTRWTPAFSADLDLLRRVAERVDVQVCVLDDRAAPDHHSGPENLNLAARQYEMCTWRLAAALTRHWPHQLGRYVELHSCGGFYDEVQLQPVADRNVSYPSPQPRISMNRPGSVWAFSQTGSPRWTWRGIWEHLATGGNPDHAALTIGAMAGLGTPKTTTATSFADIAVAFLETVDQTGWFWRCAWPDSNRAADWVERYRTPLRQYSRTPTTRHQLPTIARIWGAIHDNEAAIVIDQETLRTWIWTGARVEEVSGSDRLESVRSIAELAATLPAEVPAE